MLGIALAQRSKATADAGDIEALQRVEQRIVAELTRLEKIRKAADAIRRQAELIEKQVGIGEKNLGKLVEDANKTLTALNVELCEDELERGCPIEFGGDVADNDVVLTASGEE